MDAYSTALRLLGRRELSARQLADRLERRQFPADEIHDTIDRLTHDGTLDDRRVALAAARLHASIRGKGRRRVLQQVQRLGIDADTVKQAVNDVFDDVDEGALLDRAIDRRLKGTAVAALDAAQKARLVRGLAGQGFDPSQVLARLRQRARKGDE